MRRGGIGDVEDRQLGTTERAYLKALWRTGAAPTKIDVSKDVFCALFKTDTRFGGFGIPCVQQDPYLHVPALTSFQPYDPSILENEYDAILVLTPIYRILAVLAAIALEEVGMAQHAERLLPYRPRTGYTDLRFLSFGEVVASLWAEMCHVWVDIESKLVVRVDCFLRRERMPCIWIDVDTAAITAFRLLRDQGKTASESFAAVSKTPIVQVLHCKLPPDCMSFSAIVDELRVFQFTLYSGEHDRPQTTYYDLDQSMCIPDTAVVMEIMDDAPYIQLVRGPVGLSKKSDICLLITANGGNYSAFYRASPDGKLVSYPVASHPYHPFYEE